MPPLNQHLHNALMRRFGHVQISNEGEPAIVRELIEWVRGKPQRSTKVTGGEQYRVNCPFCNDTRGRLYFSHQWGVRDERSGREMIHLVYCFNELCVDGHEVQERLRDMVYPLGRRRPARGAQVITTVPVNPVPATPAELPAGCVPVDKLPPSHPVSRYLDERGFERTELSFKWKVSYCPGDAHAKPQVDNRIVIPLYSGAMDECGPDGPQQTLVGWQARTVGNSATSPKYLTSQGAQTSRILYGLFRAMATDGPVVVVEGPTDVWRLGANAVATLGKTVSTRQAQLIARAFSRCPIVVAYDRDAADEAYRARNRLLAARRELGDDSAVVVATLPDGCDDIGECTTRQAWDVVLQTLEQANVKIGDSPPMVLSEVVEIVDNPRRRLSRAGGRCLGDSVVVYFPDRASRTHDADEDPPVILIGDDGKVRHSTQGSRALLESVGGCRRVYFDAAATGLAKQDEGHFIEYGFDDLRIIAHLLDESSDHTIASLSDRYCPGGGPGDLHREANLQSAEHACQIARRLRRLWEAEAWHQLLEEQELMFIYHQIEIPFIPVARAMRVAGVKVDLARLAALQEAWAARQPELSTGFTKISATALILPYSTPCPPSYPDISFTQWLHGQRLATLLYDDLGLPRPPHVDPDTATVSAADLHWLSERYPVAASIEELQRLARLAKQASALKLAVNPVTGRVHSQFDAAGSRTGRIGCRVPNLDSIAEDLRETVIAGDGRRLVLADFSQMELRVLAQLTKSSSLLDAFRRGEDLHARTAGIIMGKSVQDVTSDERDIGKSVNFSVIYGQGAAGLARQLGIPHEDARAFISTFNEAYPEVLAWATTVKVQARRCGFVASLYGRRRRLPDATSDEPRLARRALRQAVNFVVQGTAADIFKLALVRLAKALPDGSRLLLPIHDAVLIEAPQECVAITENVVRRTLKSRPPNFIVPMQVQIGSGETWARCAQDASLRS